MPNFALPPSLMMSFTQAMLFVASFGMGFFMAVGFITGTAVAWRWVCRTRRSSPEV